MSAKSITKPAIGALHCPFCGSSDIHNWSSDDHGTASWSVMCFVCECEGPHTDTEVKAIELWNMRRDKAGPEIKIPVAPIPVDRSQQVLTNGAPVPDDRSHTELTASGQQKAYVVLSNAELAKGFVRPVRYAYRHTKCGAMTTMSRELAQTYARDPYFYSGTFCTTCGGHFPVGEDGEFTWYENDGSEGPKVGT